MDTELPVLQALKVRFDAHNLSASLNGPFKDTAPDPINAPFPYVVLHVADADRSETTSTHIFFTKDVLIKVYDRTAALVGSHIEVIAQAYKATLTITGASVIFWRQEGSGTFREAKRVEMAFRRYKLKWAVARDGD